MRRSWHLLEVLREKKLLADDLDGNGDVRGDHEERGAERGGIAERDQRADGGRVHGETGVRLFVRFTPIVVAKIAAERESVAGRGRAWRCDW